MKKAIGDNKYHISDDFLTEPRLFGDVYLFQLGRSFCQENSVVPEHRQREYVELTVATGGEGVIYANGEYVTIKSGEIFVSFPGDTHSIRSGEVLPLKYDFITFMPRDARLKTEISYLTRAFHPTSSRIIKSKMIADLVAAAIAELKTEAYEYEAVLDAILKQVVILTMRVFRSNESVIGADTASEAELLCYKVMNYIDLNAQSIRSLDELTESFSYNYNYLSNLFRKTTGDTIASYYRRKKLEIAHALLSSGKLKVTDVAISLGYSSVYTFSRAYKTAYGVSPKLTKSGATKRSEALLPRKEIGRAELEVSASVDVFDFGDVD